MESKIVDSPEFTAVLEKLPKYIALTPLVHRWQVGDIYNDRKRCAWTENDLNIGEIVPDNDEGQNACREIPIHIRRNAAFWALYDSLATVAPDHHGIAYLYCLINKKGEVGLTIDLENRMRHGIRKFESYEQCKEAIPILGGEQTIIHHLSSGCLLPKWMAGEV